MYKPRHLLKNVISGRNCYCYCTSSSFPKIKNCNNALVVSKLSGYEFERQRYNYMTTNELRQKLINRGTDYDRLMRSYEAHKQYEYDMVQRLQKMGFTVRIVNSFTYDEASVAWADIIFPAGGDGTFLLAAGKVRNHRLPVVGFNSAPNKSEGHLCLPKQYSKDVEAAIEKLRSGQFEWLFRKRIRVNIADNPHEIKSKTRLHEVDDKIEMEPPGVKSASICEATPHLALNEVFIGETLSARVSNLEIWLNDSAQSSTIKCSGLCLSTGTGSTSWHLSMNRIPVHTVEILLQILQLGHKEERLESAINLAKVYNDSLIYAPDDDRIAYTIREMISLGVWPQGRNIRRRGFVKTVKVKSLCFDATLVVDGGLSCEFNDGAVVEMAVLPEDALLTVRFRD